MAERLLRFIVSLFVMAMLARHLGPDDFGRFNYAIAYVALYAPLLSLGMNRTLVREFVSGSITPATLISIILRARICTALVLIPVAIGLSYGLTSQSESVTVLIVVLALGLLFQAAEPVELWFQSQSQNQRTVIIKAASLLAASAVKLVLVACHAPLPLFAWAQISELALGAIFLYRQRPIVASSPTVYTTWQTSWRLLKECWPEVISGLATMLVLRLDQLMLKALDGYEAVGVYAAGVRLSDAWYFVPGALATSFYPIILKSKSEAKKVYLDDLQQMFNALAVVAIAIVGAIWICAGPAVNIVYGAGYEEAAAVLRIHSLSILAVAFGLGSGSWIYAEGRVHLTMYRMLFAALISVSANLVLIPRYGELGAATSAVVALFCGYYLFDLIPRSMRPIFVQKTAALSPRQIFTTGRKICRTTHQALLNRVR